MTTPVLAAPPTKYVSAVVVADHFDLKQERTVLDLVKSAGLPAHRIGRQYRFDLDEVAEWGAKRAAADRAARDASAADRAASDTWLAETLAKFTLDDLRRAGEVLRAVADAATKGGAA